MDLHGSARDFLIRSTGGELSDAAVVLPWWPMTCRFRQCPALPMLALLLWLLVCCPASAREPDAALSEVGGFVDGFVAAYMREHHIAGAAVAVVDLRHETPLRRAYGIAVPGEAGKAHAASSMFRIGSVSKTFTYVAVMRLASRGLLDLEGDANLYLPRPLRIPSQGFTPVRVRHLMTHTAGFEDTNIASLAFLPPAPVPPLAQYLAHYRPQRVVAPGLRSGYSNYGVALLGAMVAQVSGMPYDDYLEQELFRPLGMDHTSCRDEPASAGGTLATPFAYADGRYRARPAPRLAFMAPAGGCASTAADMARFMRMLLLGGSLDGHEIVRAADFTVYTAVNFGHGPGPADQGLANGFFRFRHGRHLSLEHAGDIAHFHANMVLLPEAGVGVFVGTNSEGGLALASALPREVFRRYVPGAAPAAGPAAVRVSAAPRFAGLYLPQRRNVSTVEKVSGALHTIRVSVTPDGYLRIGNSLWAQRGAVDFQGAGPDNLGRQVRFIEDGAQNVVAVTIGTQYWSRAGIVDDYRVLAGMVGGTALLSLGVVAGFYRRRYGARRFLQRIGEPGTRHSALLGLCIALWVASLAVLLAGAYSVFCAVEGRSCLGFSNPPDTLRLAMLLGHAAAALVVVQACLLYQVARVPHWGRRRKLRHMGVVLWMLATVILMVHWNLLGAPLPLPDTAGVTGLLAPLANGWPRYAGMPKQLRTARGVVVTLRAIASRFAL